jgi:glycerophosphoryl diester phosphodiesterase
MSRLRQLSILLAPVILVAGAVAYVAYRTRRVPTPRSRWRRFYSPDAKPVHAVWCDALQGLYEVEDGADFFGKTTVLKWSYTVERNTTTYHLSLFCEKAGKYIVCTGKQQGADILLNGYWRKAAANGTGLVRLLLQDGVHVLQSANGKKSFVLHGLYGKYNKTPNKKLSIRFLQDLPAVRPLDIVAHRGGSRNVDFLPVSENTLQMTRMAARLGANGIEIDVRMTKDGVPVIFHDAFFSLHTIRNKVWGGWLHDKTFKEVRRMKLRKGGQVPTLDEILYTALCETPLEVVWLDVKKECDLEAIRNVQQAYNRKAAELGRTFRVYIGIPERKVLNCFRALDDYENTPSLVEMDRKTALSVNADVWAPQYTGGFQSSDVAKVHAAGKKAYVWSLDSRLLIDLYVHEGAFDGLVTNAAPVVVHWLYTHGMEESVTAGR